MAEPEEIATLSLLVGGTPDLPDEQLGPIIDSNAGDLDAAAAVVWEIRAAKYHALVNISESGSSRNMGDLYKNAIAMAQYYRGKKLVDETPVETGVTRTRRIVRG